MTTEDYPISFFHETSSEMFRRIFAQYKGRSKSVLQSIKQDKSLSRFDGFNKRIKIACGLEITFSDSLGIVKPDTRACYALMYKIADVWYAFEHLLSVADSEMPRLSRSKIVLYSADVMAATGLTDVESHFCVLMSKHVTAETAWRRELYRLLAYIINNTKGGTKIALQECMASVKAKRSMRFQDLLALSYGLRNLYVHEGVMAAMGTRDYALKRRMYEVLLDCLILASFTLGSEYAGRVIATMRKHEAEAGVTGAAKEIATCGPVS